MNLSKRHSTSSSEFREFVECGFVRELLMG